MIAKPTTPDQALENAVLAAETAHTLMAAMSNRYQIMTVSQANSITDAVRGWTATSEAWSRIAAQMSNTQAVTEDDETVTIPLETYRVLRGIAVREADSRKSPDRVGIGKRYLNSIKDRNLVITERGEGYWTVEVRDNVAE